VACERGPTCESESVANSGVEERTNGLRDDDDMVSLRSNLRITTSSEGSGGVYVEEKKT
jgi:hypothetical protein